MRTLGTNSVELKRNSYIPIEENATENVVCEMAAILSRLQRVTTFNFRPLTSMEAILNDPPSTTYVIHH